MDFIVRRTDGSAYRLHPGSTRKQDAKPHYLPPSSFTNESTATEHTHTNSSAFSWPKAQLIPQSDRIGRRQAWHRLTAIRTEHRERGVDATLDLSDGTIFPWKLLFCNFAHSTAPILGAGICTVHLSLDEAHEITLFIRRIDNTDDVIFLRKNSVDFGER